MSLSMSLHDKRDVINKPIETGTVIGQIYSYWNIDITEC